MTQELWMAIWAGVFDMVVVLAGAAAPFTVKGYIQWNAGPRDKPFEIPEFAGRLKRAHSNFMESFVLFALVVVALALAHKSTDLSVWGARAYLAARILYVPLYVSGIPGPRSLIWWIAAGGIVACLFALII